MRTWSAVAVGFVVVGAACTETEIQYVEREPFNPPPDAAAGFLGYYTPGTKQTTCGNCHIGSQTAWVETQHAEAYDDLVGSGDAQTFCFGCHAVSERGNAVDSAAGYNRIADSAYRDVQCESCHGPGLVHVQDPGATQPLASIAADTNLANGCGECHSGVHTPFVEQWKASKHGSPSALSYAGARPECAGCHEGRTALVEKFGESARYIEKDETVLQPFVCAVCHDPHGSPNPGQLRAPIDVPTRENLCITCHSRKGTPVPPTNRGPHAGQGLLLIGEAGWMPAGFQYDSIRIVGSHGTLANQRLCATCHVTRFDVSDAATGAFLLTSVGHRFEAIGCLDAQGLPADGPCAPAERDFRACASAGCHATEGAARSVFQVVQTRLDNLLDQLWFDADGDANMDAYPEDSGLLARVVALGDPANINLTDQVLTVAEGAIWNAQLAYTSSRPQWGGGTVFGRAFSGARTSGEGVHNPFLLEALLIASIQAVQTTYGLAAPPVDLSPQMTAPPGLAVR